MNKQSWDEVRHARYFKNFVTQELGEEVGECNDKDCPDKKFLDPFYDEANSLADQGELVQLHSGNMLIGEGYVYWAIKAMTDGCGASGIYPTLVRIGKIVERDEIFHINNVRRVLARYASDEEGRERGWKGAKYYMGLLPDMHTHITKLDTSQADSGEGAVGRIGKTVRKF